MTREQELREDIERLSALAEARLKALDRYRQALEKIAGRREYDLEDVMLAGIYKPDEGLWTTNEYLADMALGN